MKFAEMISTVRKLKGAAKGTITKDQALELCAQMGFEVEASEIPLEQQPAAAEISSIAAAAVREGSHFWKLIADHEGGLSLCAFVVLSQKKVINNP
jgi:hypothetical protein